MATLEDMEEVVMGCCGAIVWLQKKFMADKRETGDTFYCPNGHGRHFKKTRAERLQEELDGVRKTLADKTAKLEGVKAGKCPWCWRTVKNLNAHIARRH